MPRRSERVLDETAIKGTCSSFLHPPIPMSSPVAGGFSRSAELATPGPPRTCVPVAGPCSSNWPPWSTQSLRRACPRQQTLSAAGAQAARFENRCPASKILRRAAGAALRVLGLAAGELVSTLGDRFWTGRKASGAARSSSPPSLSYTRAPPEDPHAPAAPSRASTKRITVLFADHEGLDGSRRAGRSRESPETIDRFFAILFRASMDSGDDQPIGQRHSRRVRTPIAHRDHARRACYAALDLQRRAAALRGGAPAASAASAVSVADGPQLGRGGGRQDSATTCGWTTRRRATQSVSPRGWSRWRIPGRCSSQGIRRSWFRATSSSETWDARGSRGVDEPVGLYDLEGVGSH